VVDAVRAQVLEQQVTVRIAPHATDHRHAAAQAGRRDRLIGALSAQAEREIGPGHRLAGGGKPISKDSQIRIDAAYDQNSGLFHLPATSPVHGQPSLENYQRG
jgi:hypothetical protein